jgi:hypothetical protein
MDGWNGRDSWVAAFLSLLCFDGHRAFNTPESGMTLRGIAVNCMVDVTMSILHSTYHCPLAEPLNHPYRGEIEFSLSSASLSFPLSHYISTASASGANSFPIIRPPVAIICGALSTPSHHRRSGSLFHNASLRRDFHLSQVLKGRLCC